MAVNMWGPSELKYLVDAMRTFVPGCVCCSYPQPRGVISAKIPIFFSILIHRSLLQSGKSVMSSDGITMVHPDDVMDPSSPGPIFILVDCPSAEYMPALLSNPVLCSFQEPNVGTPSKQVTQASTLVVHIDHPLFVPASVCGLPEYQSWMSRFGRAQHVIAGHGTLDMSQPVLKASARVVSRLNRLCPQVFPVSGLQPGKHRDEIMETKVHLKACN